MSRDLFSQIISADPVEFKRRRLHPRGVVQSVSGNMATIVVGNDANGAQMVMEDVPIASGVTVAVDDFVEIGYDNGHPAAPYVAGGSANVSGSSEPGSGSGGAAPQAGSAEISGVGLSYTITYTTAFAIAPIPVCVPNYSTSFFITLPTTTGFTLTVGTAPGATAKVIYWHAIPI